MWWDKEGVACREESWKGQSEKIRGKKGKKDKRLKQERNLAANKSITTCQWVFPTSGNAQKVWHLLRSCKQGFCSLGDCVVGWHSQSDWKAKKKWMGGDENKQTLMSVHKEMPATNACNHQKPRDVVKEGRCLIWETPEANGQELDFLTVIEQLMVHSQTTSFTKSHFSCLLLRAKYGNLFSCQKESLA